MLNAQPYVVIHPRSGNLMDLDVAEATFTAERCDLFRIVEINGASPRPIAKLPERRAEPVLARKRKNGGNADGIAQGAQKRAGILNVVHHTHNDRVIAGWNCGLG